jgi:hypothetical protein
VSHSYTCRERIPAGNIVPASYNRMQQCVCIDDREDGQTLSAPSVRPSVRLLSTSFEHFLLEKQFEHRTWYAQVSTTLWVHPIVP